MLIDKRDWAVNKPNHFCEHAQRRYPNTEGTTSQQAKRRNKRARWAPGKADKQPVQPKNVPKPQAEQQSGGRAQEAQDTLTCTLSGTTDLVKNRTKKERNMDTSHVCYAGFNSELPD